MNEQIIRALNDRPPNPAPTQRLSRYQDELDDLAALVAYADAVYERVWIGRKVTPSA